MGFGEALALMTTLISWLIPMGRSLVMLILGAEALVTSISSFVYPKVWVEAKGKG